MAKLWRSLLLLLCFISSFPAFAQSFSEDEGIISKAGYNRLLGFGVGPVYRSFLDKSLSDILYHRAGATVCITNEKTDDVQFTELSFQASYLNMHRASDDIVKATARSFKAVADYRHTYRINFLNENKYDVRVGGILSGLFDYRNAPQLAYSGHSYDYAVSLGAYGKIARNQNFNGKAGSIVIDASLPFVSDMGRPPLNNTGGLYDPSYKPVAAFFSGNKLASFGGLLRIITRVYIMYPLKNGNKIRFTYQWDYYKMKGATTVYSAEHTLMMAFMFNY